MLLHTYNIRRVGAISVLLYLALSWNGWLPSREIPMYSSVNLYPSDTIYNLSFFLFILCLVIYIIKPNNYILTFAVLIYTFNILIDHHKYAPFILFSFFVMMTPLIKSNGLFNNVQYLTILLSIFNLGILLNKINPFFFESFPIPKVHELTKPFIITITSLQIISAFLFLTNFNKRKLAAILYIITSALIIIPLIIINFDYPYIALNVLIIYLSTLIIIDKNKYVDEDGELPVLNKSTKIILVSLALLVMISSANIIPEKFSFLFYTGKEKEIMVNYENENKIYIPKTLVNHSVQINNNEWFVNVNYAFTKEYNLYLFQDIKAMKYALSNINPKAFDNFQCVILIKDDETYSKKQFTIYNPVYGTY